MDLRQHLEQQCSEDFKLLKELENRLRSEEDPRRKLRLNDDIEEIKQKIRDREAEIKSLDISSSLVFPPSELPTKEFSAQNLLKNKSSAKNNFMSVQPDQAIDVFFSYAHEDEKLRDKLEQHLSSLKRERVITGWHDRKIGAGKEWQNEIDKHLNTSQIILLLISENFMASDYCWDVEVKRAMELHELQEARVIPIILDFVDWKNAPFGRLQHLPKGNRPVKKWGNRNDAFYNVAQGIRIVAKELTE
ncbi:toll/interleukin-1 receptor domain-containing protein [Calothrix sp. PCC 7507]|uniref:toll/interleukin-1 receptor domain-containing protein n=1 Tax=Calothrix sp. PCC 7507 TaxID=99598 RepID=UPI00029F4E81|nr:toll/interleukin-1 receptor domain-containing protein [Calothrix sp. PCC 7507]AFY35566.1 TIR protein [Calothrix sp. PCC 7507]